MMIYGTEHIYELLECTHSWWICGVWIAVIFTQTNLLGYGGACAWFPIKLCLSYRDINSTEFKRNSLLSLYRMMPLRAMSRLWGKFNELTLPKFSRVPLLSLYVRMFGCNVEEAAVEDLTHYKNLGEFFRRALKPGVRTIDPTHSLVMPSDGKVLNFGEVINGQIEQVKGVTYSLKGFLGPSNQDVYRDTNNSSLAELEIDQKLRKGDQELMSMTDTERCRSVLHNPENSLYHMVIYLAPGDYHRFHSPTDWVVEHRRHFPGDLMSVNPMIAQWVKGLFNFNERALYTGTWKHGFFSMTAVGATNVGSIKTYFDRGLTTNLRGHSGREGIYKDQAFPQGVLMKKGELFGEFNLGSTIVLVFEAPKNFEWNNVAAGKPVRMGEGAGDRIAKKYQRASAA